MSIDDNPHCIDAHKFQTQLESIQETFHLSSRGFIAEATRHDDRCEHVDSFVTNQGSLQIDMSEGFNYTPFSPQTHVVRRQCVDTRP
jgi:hypothetical protein